MEEGPTGPPAWTTTLTVTHREYSEERHVIDDDENDEKSPTNYHILWVPERNEETPSL